MSEIAETKIQASFLDESLETGVTLSGNDDFDSFAEQEDDELPEGLQLR